MSKYPHTDLIEAPALNWYYLFPDLLTIESGEDTPETFHAGKYIVAYVECFTRADGYYHWQVHKHEETSHGWMETIEEAQADCEE